MYVRELRPSGSADHPDDRIRAIELDNVERNDVLDERTVLELYAAIEDADRAASVDAILLGTTGDVFCAGADLRELKFDYEGATRFLTGYFETIDLLRETSKPAVAAVEGNRVAGGNELVNACDLIVAGESTQFGQPEVLVGSTAAGGALQLLPLIVGEKRAREMLLTGELLDARRPSDTASSTASSTTGAPRRKQWRCSGGSSTGTVHRRTA